MPVYNPQPPQMSNPFGMSQGGQPFGSIPMSSPSAMQLPLRNPNYRGIAPGAAANYPMSGGQQSYSDVGTIYRSGRDDVGGNGASPSSLYAGGGQYPMSGGRPVPGGGGGGYPMSGGQPQGRARVAPGFYPMSGAGGTNGNPPSDGSTPPPRLGSFGQPWGTPPMSGAYANTSPNGSRAQIGMTMRNQQAADRIHANPLAGQTPNQPMQMSEDAAREMYHGMQANYPGQNIDQQFVDHMRDQYHQDGAALLKSWATGGTLGQPVATYQPGQPAQPIDLGAQAPNGNFITNPGSPISPYGRFNDGNAHQVAMPNGDTIVVDDQGRSHGPPIAHHSPLSPLSPGYGPGVLPQPGVMAPYVSGYQPPSPTPAAPSNFSTTSPTDINGWGAMAPGVAQGRANAANVPPGWTPAQAAEMTRLRTMQADNLDADAEARRETIPPTQREQFNAGVDVAQTAAGQPAAVAGAKMQGAQNVAQTNATGKVNAAQATGQSRVQAATATGQSRVQAAQTNGLSNQEVARIRNEGRPVSLGKQPESPQEKSLNDRYVAATSDLKSATENYRTLLSQYGTTADAQKLQELAQAKQQRDQARDNTFAAQKMREDYYDGVSGPAMNAAKPAAGTPAPTAQPSAAQEGATGHSDSTGKDYVMRGGKWVEQP